MVESTLHLRGLPDDFANRIGRLVTAGSGLIEALFDPASLPDLLSELLISDEANKRAVSVQVVQRSGDGIVRGVATTPVDAMPSGPTVLNTGRQTPTPVYQIGSNASHRCSPDARRRPAVKTASSRPASRSST
jgi:hypothetical protein